TLKTPAADDHFLDHDVFCRPVAQIARRVDDGIDGVLAFDHFAENAVLAVEPGSGLLYDEELTAIGIWASVSHGKTA
ncbi:MAG: hypothetical protein HW373_21, partial [Deltaproteobacteria bacterium]|nr:hypothetical protein [Deltaproteobacteria bacterium]